MTLGPLEYLVVGFEGNRFTGQILSELRAAREKGIIRVVDLFVLKKDENGNVTSMELSDLSGEEAEQFGSLAGDIVGLLAPEDIEQTAAYIPNNSAAGLLLRTYLGYRLEGSDQECRWRSCGRRAGGS